MSDFITHTFCECGENHKGMQQLGSIAAQGVPMADLRALAQQRPDLFQIVDLSHGGVEAGVLLMRGGVEKLLGKGKADALLAESRAQRFDDRFLNTDRNPPVVMNKLGRVNNVYADFAQEPDIPAGRGTVVDFATTPLMAALRAALPAALGEWARGLIAETNWYQKVSDARVGIGFHGDTERRIVVGVRLGEASTPLRFQCYVKSLPVSEETSIELAHGDLYVMSDRAVGWNWKSDLCNPTFRHGTGRKAVKRAIGEVSVAQKRRRAASAAKRARE